MHRLSKSTLCALGLLLTACGDPANEVSAPFADSAVPRSGGSSNQLSEACWGVGVMPVSAAACPALNDPDWVRHGDHMFVDGSGGLSALGLSSSTTPTTLGQFCLYQWTGQGEPVVGTLPATLDEFSVDCPAAEPLGNANSPYLDDAEHALLRAQIEAPESDPTLSGAPVVIGLVDGSSSLPASGDAMEHADALEDIILDAACPSTGCGVEVVRTLGLPLDETGALVDPNGGLYGTRAHVALGIVEAVERWKEAAATGDPSTRLVINLSLGWVAASSGSGCGTSEAEPWCLHVSHVDAFQAFMSSPTVEYPTRVAVESVHAALLYATCNGAIVVASAGNTKTDSCNDEPVAPAAWAQFPAPSFNECVALGFGDPPNAGSDFSIARPLLHPISGVQASGEPIALTRPGSETRLVAAGSHATAGPHTALTGTSVSAAVASSAFALLWSQDAVLSPGDVIARVTDGAQPVPRLSELAEYGAGAGTPIRNVSLCGALEEHALASGTPVPTGCMGLPLLETAIEDMDDAVDDVLTNFSPSYDVDASLVSMETDSCMACGDPVDVFLPDLDTDEDHYFFNTCIDSPASWVPDEGPSLAGPQPDIPICPECPLSAGAAELVSLISIDDAYRSGVTIDGASLIVYFGSTKKRYDLDVLLEGVGKLQTESKVRISLPSGGVVPSRALIEAKMTDGRGDSFYRSSEFLIARSK